MPYIVDGHNLIPKIPRLNLADLDDENQLIEMLQEFCRHRRKKVEVYFDNAPPGQLRARNYGVVTAHYVRAGQTADNAIHKRLKRLGRASRNWTIVSSDRSVQASAKTAKAHVLTSEEFANELTGALESFPMDLEQQDAPILTPNEVEDWLDIFGGEKADE